MDPTLVHYVLESGACAGEHRPAIVVKKCPPEWGYPEDDRAVQLQVFTDGSNDGGIFQSGMVWRTSVKYSETKELGTWHYIEE